MGNLRHKVPVVSAEPNAMLLREVSRSFYLSLRVLPQEMRAAASWAYLLARLSDTIADCDAPVEDRMKGLEEFVCCLKTGAGNFRHGLEREISATAGEMKLLEKAEGIFASAGNLPEAQWKLVREVVETIVSGQRLDLERFGKSGGVMPDFPALEDYTWRVAGCVGEFWTKLGFLTCGRGFSDFPQDVLSERGRRFGMGLQLVNILRDVKEDLAAERCYLPGNHLLETHRALRETARAWVGNGLDYGRAMKGWRLRMAAQLPARLGLRTLDLMEKADAEVFHMRVKVPRRYVYLDLFRCFTVCPIFSCNGKS